MSIRVKIVLVIAAIVGVITLSSTGLGDLYVRNRLAATIESDMEVVSKIADRLVLSEINLRKADLRRVAEDMYPDDASLTQDAILNELSRGVFRSISFMKEDGTVKTFGVPVPSVEFMGSDYVKNALSGSAIISSTERTGNDELVFWVCVPAQNGVVIAALPESWLARTVAKFQIWQTGSIFVLDKEGTMIAYINQDVVSERQNFIEMAQTDPSYLSAANFYRNILSGDAGVGRYSYDGKERICAYRPITGSQEGWFLGVTSPISESPLAQVDKAMLMTGTAFLGLGVLVALYAAKFIANPFERIAEQNARLEDLRKIAESTSEAKSDFLANMSHEMRTPLNAIIGLSELSIDMGCSREEAVGNLEKIYGAGVTLLGIINDILDISKIESGKFELIPAEYDTPSLINDTVMLNSMRIAEKPINFRLHIDAGTPCRLFGDELRIKQIFNNLLSNAFKYTKEGQVDWSVGFERDQDSLWLISSVKDTGIGIRRKDIDKLFMDYNQVDVKSNRAIEGTGLGLSITKRMVEMMDGTISVESEYGVGSTFSVKIRQGFVSDLPIGDEVAGNLRDFHYSDDKRSRNSKLVRINLPYARVLVVDDVKTNLDVAKGMLKPYGMQVDCVTSGPQAINLIHAAEVTYNAIFMDHMMPEMDGIEATKAIRAIGSDYARGIPIIALTANAIAGNDEMFLANGFQAFLSKPIDIFRMDQVIRQWVRDRRQEEAPLPEESSGQVEEDRRLRLPDTWRVDGIDLEKAAERFSWDEVSLLEVLRSYAENTCNLLEQAEGCRVSGTFSEYATIVHGIKGSSYGICADRVGDLAKELEHAARDGDIGYVESNHGIFMEEAGRLLGAMSSMLSGIGTEGKPRKMEPDSELLTRLKDACRTYSMDAVDEVMGEIERYEYESDEGLIAWIREQVDSMEFTRIEERLASF
ncbi:MAG: response regulator [Synergistaceae bacterium]|jgi:signal transduction histidine kinase/DNA-binding response OmpR family regulator|nr:response regulator [Synergistaceae bacterium]